MNWGWNMRNYEEESANIDHGKEFYEKYIHGDYEHIIPIPVSDAMIEGAKQRVRDANNGNLITPLYEDNE